MIEKPYDAQQALCLVSRLELSQLQEALPRSDEHFLRFRHLPSSRKKRRQFEPDRANALEPTELAQDRVGLLHPLTRFIGPPRDER